MSRDPAGAAARRSPPIRSGRLGGAAKMILKILALLLYGSDRGRERAAAMYSPIVTCRMNEVDPQAWLADILERIAGRHPAHRVDELLPWN